MKKKATLLIYWVILMAFPSCQSFLDEKPNKSILVPSTLEDVRAILDYYTNLNENPLIIFILSDDWVTTSQNWDSFNPWEQNAYLWQEQIFEPNQRSTDYNRINSKIFYANVCLDILDGLQGDSDQINVLKGEALVLRGRALFDLAQLFLPHPESSNAVNKTVPVSLDADINSEPLLLGIVEVMDLIEKDLVRSTALLKEESLYKTRPDQLVVQSLLSRLYLYQQDWVKALTVAEAVLQSNNGLMDYKNLTIDDPYPFQLFNSETLFYGVTSSFSVTASSATFINPDLFKDYDNEDLRKHLFFALNAEGVPLFKGSYTGDYNLFTGISLPEMILAAAESAVRLGEVDKGIAYLNQLGENRYLDFTEWNIQDSETALDLVLKERRKELIFRGLRWMDMKRLRMESLVPDGVREINGEVFQLDNEDQFTLKLPEYEIELEAR